MRTLILLPDGHLHGGCLHRLGHDAAFRYRHCQQRAGSLLDCRQQGFLRDRYQALPVLASITIWKEVGLSMIFYLAGLLAIPGVYYEAARIDGAGRWQQFRYMTLPLLNRTHVFVLVTGTIAAFKVFVPVEVLTDGGPSNATRVIVHYIFHLAFRFNRFSYATALSVILAVILIAISIFQMRITRDDDDD